MARSRRLLQSRHAEREGAQVDGRIVQADGGERSGDRGARLPLRPNVGVRVVDSKEGRRRLAVSSRPVPVGNTLTATTRPLWRPNQRVEAASRGAEGRGGHSLLRYQIPLPFRQRSTRIPGRPSRHPAGHFRTSPRRPHTISRPVQMHGPSAQESLHPGAARSNVGEETGVPSLRRVRGREERRPLRAHRRSTDPGRDMDTRGTGKSRRTRVRGMFGGRGVALA